MKSKPEIISRAEQYKKRIDEHWRITGQPLLYEAGYLTALHWVLEGDDKRLVPMTEKEYMEWEAWKAKENTANNNSS